MTKRECKKAYLSDAIGLSEALECLVFDYCMMRGAALEYLGL